MNSKTAIRQLKALKKYTPNESLRLAAEWNGKWKILIATILSAQTRDETTIKVCNKLFKKYTALKKLSKASLKDISKIIRPINYYKTKSFRILKTAKIISKKHNGKIPAKREELLELPGIGRKVANVYLAEAHKENTIGVDTHVRRISKKLGWTKNDNPYKIEKDLEKLFPKKYWRVINYNVVRFGRSYWNRGKSGKIKENKIIEQLVSYK
jgi:endonuclease-3